ncbi:MAG: response regulator [Anaerolineae bacterium]|nr:response regulator [Anaerolineae bacterium]
MDNQQKTIVKENILIVDDVPMNLKLLATMLDNDGYQVRTANSGKMALEAVESLLPDLILLDVRMPDMDGYMVCQRLKADKQTKNIPIIFISALDATKDKIKGFAVGGVDYISKPIQPQEVLTRVKTHLALRNAHKELEQKNAQLARVNDDLTREIAERIRIEETLQRTRDRLETTVQEQTAHLRTVNAQLEHTNAALMHEIAERRRAEETLRLLHNQVEHHAQELEQRVADQTRELVAMYDVMTIASQSLDLDTILARSLKRVLDAIKSNKGAVHLLDEKGEMLHLAAQRGLSADISSQIASLPAEGLGKWSDRSSEAILIPNIRSNSHAAAPTIQLQRYTGIPMRAGGRALGMLGILRETTQPKFSPQEMDLLTSLADRVGAVVESARLRQLAEQAAVLEERQRLARDLHDSVTQSLYSLTLLTEGGRRLVESGDLENVQDYFVDLGEIAFQSLKEIRLLVHELRPPVLEQEGLVGALQQRLDAVEGRSGVNARLLLQGRIELSEQVEKELYSIVMEALNNALKHAAATALTVKIGAPNGRIEIEIEDNGCGFDPGSTINMGGIGLSTMKERAERLGGTLTIRSAPGEGTTIHVKLAEPEPHSQYPIE